MVLRLAEILRAKQFRQANDLRAVFGGFAINSSAVRKICLWLRAAAHLHQRDLCFLRIGHGGSAAPRAMLNTYREAIKTMGLTTQVNIARRSARSTYFTESAGTILMLSTVTRLVGLLRSPLSLVVTSVSPIFPRTSSPFMIFPNVVY